jgi:hypothetical protein
MQNIQSVLYHPKQKRDIECCKLRFNMARATSPVLLHGKLGDMIFKVINGKQFAYKAPEESRHNKLMKGGDFYDNYRRNQLELGGASVIACEIYMYLKFGQEADLTPIFRPYSHNIISGRLKTNADHDRKRRTNHTVFANQFSVADAKRALTGLDLSHDESATDQVKMIALGPQHNPTSIQLLGLERAAEAIKVLGNARLEFRIHLRQTNCRESVVNANRNGWDEVVRLPEGVTHDARQNTFVDQDGNNLGAYFPYFKFFEKASEWIPANIIPKEGFTLNLPEHQPQQTFTTAVMIEWREQRTVGRRIVKHHKMGIARIVAVHGPADAFPPPTETPARVPFPWEIDKPLLEIDWEKDPKAYLSAALGGLGDLTPT